MTNSKVVPLHPGVNNEPCDHCGKNSADRSFQMETFPYGDGKDRVILRVRVPVWTCSECGVQYTDGDAEEIRHDAVCRHLGRLTPAEVRAIREKYDLSQADWAERTGFGTASVKRWETGHLIQGEAADRHLRLLNDRDVFAKAILIFTRSQTTYRFQTNLPPSAYEEAAAFTLRKRCG